LAQQPFSDSKLILPVTDSVSVTETPFNKRYCCWFCGEPNGAHFTFPPQNTSSPVHYDEQLLITCPHPVISVPSCSECHKLAKNAFVNTIWAVKSFVKKKLIKRYAKDLAIGINWTEQELASSEFEDGNFAGFAKSAWFMYGVAKTRVNYVSWPLVINGIELDELLLDDVATAPFNFDGVVYPSLAEAISHYAKTFFLDEQYVATVLQHMSQGDASPQSFAQAVRFCRLLVNATPHERKVAFKELVTES
jgi:hypothetical protein